MNNNYSMQMMPMPQDNLYPEIYNNLYPMVVEAAQDFRRRGFHPTSQMIDETVDNIIRNSGMWDEDEDDMVETFADAVPVQFSFDRRMPRRRFHNRHTLRDLARILLLRELFGRRGF